MKRLKIAILSTSLTIAISASASFGPLPGATFSGSGIPNDAVEVTTITDGGNTITLGLTATPRYQVGELANDGNGTFYASAGMQWNFDYYVNVAGGGSVSSYNFVLGYALVPGTPTANLGSINLNAAYPSATTTIQDSEWPGFGFLAAGVAGIVSPPAGPYDINAGGDYQFVLDAYSGSTLIGQSDITVDVVPEPTTMLAGALLLLPFGASTLRILRKSRAA